MGMKKGRKSLKRLMALVLCLAQLAPCAASAQSGNTAPTYVIFISDGAPWPLFESEGYGQKTAEIKAAADAVKDSGHNIAAVYAIGIHSNAKTYLELIADPDTDRNADACAGCDADCNAGTHQCAGYRSAAQDRR